MQRKAGSTAQITERMDIDQAEDNHADDNPFGIDISPNVKRAGDDLLAAIAAGIGYDPNAPEEEGEDDLLTGLRTMHDQLSQENRPPVQQVDEAKHHSSDDSKKNGPQKK